MSATHTGGVWGGWCATYMLPLESLSPFQMLHLRHFDVSYPPVFVATPDATGMTVH